MKAILRHIYLCRTANMSWRMCVVVKQIQSNPTNHLMLAAASPQDVDDREEMVNILKKGSCFVPPHPKVGLLGHLQLPARQWVQLCQVSKDLWRACLPGRKIFLSLWICGRSGLAAWSPATLCGLLLLTAWQEHPGRGPWVGSWSMELCWAVLALGMQGHDLASQSAGTF